MGVYVWMMAEAKPKPRRRRKTTEPTVTKRLPAAGGKQGRPRKPRAGERKWQFSWSEVAELAFRGATAEDIALALEVPGDEATQAELRKVVEREAARMRCALLEKAVRSGLKEGKGFSATTLQACLRNLGPGWDQDGLPPTEMPNIQELSESLERAAAAIKAKKEEDK